MVAMMASTLDPAPSVRRKLDTARAATCVHSSAFGGSVFGDSLPSWPRGLASLPFGASLPFEASLTFLSAAETAEAASRGSSAASPASCSIGPRRRRKQSVDGGVGRAAWGAEASFDAVDADFADEPFDAAPDAGAATMFDAVAGAG